MKKIILICALSIAVLFNLLGQSTFQNFYNQGISFTESYDIIATQDGGQLVCGNTTCTWNTKH